MLLFGVRDWAGGKHLIFWEYLWNTHVLVNSGQDSCSSPWVSDRGRL